MQIRAETPMSRFSTVGFPGGKRPMPIDCGYCGGTHPTAKDVKDCWEDRGRPKNSRSGRRNGGPTRTVTPPPAAEEDAPPSPPAPVAPSRAMPTRKAAPRPPVHGRKSVKSVKSVKSNKRRRPSELLHDGPSSAKRKRGSKAGPGSAKPKKSKIPKCSACGMAISIDGKCGCS